ncbi:MAG: NUDIX domain-containing protein [Planctomycetes bacterium]|nr:NUDIX domain-containing protein [Planctomycetota bacterium]
MLSEMLDIVDENDRVIGQAPRRVCHGDPSLMHRVVHIMVFNNQGALLLQRRGMNKRIQPGKWDTSVGGHLSQGEGYEEGAARELEEELGIRSKAFKKMYDYIWRSEIETERVRTFYLVHGGPVQINQEEIMEARFWTIESVKENLGRGLFTPNFEVEWKRHLQWKDGR